jgi:hypothetical protein
MEEENHFTQTLLPALFAALAAGLLPMAAPLSLYCLALSALSQCLFIGKIFKVVPFYKPQKIDYIERESDKTNNPI